jgi:hypothetical protein
VYYFVVNRVGRREGERREEEEEEEDACPCRRRAQETSSVASVISDTRDQVPEGIDVPLSFFFSSFLHFKSRQAELKI